MPETVARILDWGNDRLVHWRVGDRQPVPDRRRFDTYLDGIGGEIFPDPGTLGPFEPRPAERSADRDRPPGWRRLWRATTPWPGAEGENRDWRATRFSPDGATRPDSAVIVLHGWLADWWNYPIYLSWCRWLSGLGVEAWAPRLPHHMERTADGRVSGERCLSSDLVATTESIRQAVTEVRLLGRWLRRRGRRRIGIWGMSLGGWIGGLTATVEPGWDGVVLWAPAVDPDSILWESSLARGIRAAVRSAGIERGDGARALEALAPAERELRVPADRVLLVAGRYDGVVAPDSLVRLAARWGVGLWWMPHGHISLLASPSALATTRRFLEDRLLVS